MRRYLGQRVLFNVQRQLMLDITSRYWVEHLTEMEVLRQGIGLQSYAQKDPLAEYKVRAYDMFQELLRAIQSEVVTAMFTYRPRDLSQVRVGIDRRRQGQSTPSNQDKRLESALAKGQQFTEQVAETTQETIIETLAPTLSRLHTVPGYGTIFSRSTDWQSRAARVDGARRRREIEIERTSGNKIDG